MRPGAILVQIALRRPGVVRGSDASPMPRRRPKLPVLSSLTLAAVLLLAGGSGVLAQGDPTPSTTPGSSSTTATTEATTTTTDQPGLTIPGTPESTTTTAAPTSTTGPGGSVPPGDPAYGDGGDGDGAPPPGTPRTVPADAQRLINSVVRSRPNSTYALIEALRPLEAEGYSPTEAALVGFGAFPVAGPTTFVHDWLFPRYVPSFHLHQGTDLFAPLGTPVRAPFDGILRHSDGPVGGLASYVTAPDGSYAYLAHLSALFPGQVDGMAVRQGDVVGFVGNTGNAAGGATHVHFELHPKGGAAADPKATLDAWIADALARAPGVIARIRAQRQAPAASGASVTGVAPVEPGVPAAAADTPAGPEALWAVAANPSAGTLDVAANLVAGALTDVDWTSRGALPQGQAAAVLDPLFPSAFASA
jgi:murein DD-endopeptidase MepM/ murein hydrolase activator NlpD